MALFASVSLLSLSACSAPEDAVEPGLPGGGGRASVVRQRVDLRAALGRPDLDPVGVARDGTRTLIFDRTAGLFELGQGPVMTALPDPGVEVRLPFTDLVHMGGDRFAVTAIGDGFLLDVGAETMTQHFCYEPGFGEWEPNVFEQRTDAVAYDAEADVLYAQPQTIDVAEGLQTASSIGIYDGATGFLLDWRELAPDFVAGGLAVRGGGLLVGSGAALYTYDVVGAGGLVEVEDLGRFGVRSIAGLALEGDALYVVDGETDELLQLDLARLGL